MNSRQLGKSSVMAAFYLWECERRMAALETIKEIKRKNWSRK